MGGIWGRLALPQGPENFGRLGGLVGGGGVLKFV